MQSAWQIWSCGDTSKFPRSQRFVLDERIEPHLYDLLGALIQARYVRERQALLRQANLSLEVLRFQLRWRMTCDACEPTASASPASCSRRSAAWSAAG
jgi:hypothetical protein